ncbi:MAG: DUF1569 domain-containing protein [Flavisolibacter sp.]|nr:DUF1569 domain-containing protein [Flavisolibacter sp.]
MENLYNQTAAQNTITRLQALQPNSQPRWGKMNAAQMMAHCKAPFQIYFGELKLKRSLVGFLFGSMAKRKLFTDKPWPQNLPTAKEFIVADDRDFERERTDLIQEIERFSTSGKKDNIPAHPFFGKMSADEWSRLAFKHLEHHLQQFGV